MHYFDTSFIAPLFLNEKKSKYVEKILQSIQNDRIASHWLRIEFASLIAKYVRMKLLNEARATQLVARFETLIMDSFVLITPTVADFNLAISLLKNSESGLRSGDALHLAMAQNHHALTSSPA